MTHATTQDVEQKIFEIVRIPRYISQEQKLVAHELVALSRIETETPQKTTSLESFLFELKGKRDKVLARSSNSKTSQPWIIESESVKKNLFAPMGIEKLVENEPVRYVSMFTSPKSASGLSIKKFVEALHEDETTIIIQDILSTIALIGAFERLGLSRKDHVPKRIVCLAKYNSMKKGMPVVHIFNLTDTGYVDSVIDTNSIIGSDVNVPIFLLEKDAERIS